MSEILNILQKQIVNKIYSIRNLQIMLDRDLQSQIGASRIISRSTTLDDKNLKLQNVISSEHSGRRKRPFVFTEQGVFFENQVYHIGASLKDLGKKGFAFFKMDKSSVSILNSISEIL